MRDLYAHIIDNHCTDCLELGTGFGATSCVMAAALQVTGGRPLITVDRQLMEPVGVTNLAAHVGVAGFVEPIVETLGYEWYLSDLRNETPDNDGRFDLVVLDGAHEWVADALAVYQVVDLIRRGGWLVLDDLDFTLRGMAGWQESHSDRSGRELDTAQVGMVFDRVVRRHPQFTNHRITHAGRVGWAQRRTIGSRLAAELRAVPRLAVRRLKGYLRS